MLLKFKNNSIHFADVSQISSPKVKTAIRREMGGITLRAIFSSESSAGSCEYNTCFMYSTIHTTIYICTDTYKCIKEN